GAAPGRRDRRDRREPPARAARDRRRGLRRDLRGRRCDLAGGRRSRARARGGRRMTALAPPAGAAVGGVGGVAVAAGPSGGRRAPPWQTVAWGIALQLGLGLLLLKTPVGRGFFASMSALVAALIACTDAGVRFVFGALVDTGFSFAVNVLPTIVFMSS